MLADALGIGADTIGLVQHHELSPQAPGPPPKVFIVEHGVAVLLGIRHPDHRVDVGKQLVHPRAMLGCRRIDVGEVEDGHVGERSVRVIPNLANVEPLQQRSGLVSCALGDPCDRCPRRRTARARRAHDAARERVQQARLADPCSADEGKHVRRSLEPKPLSRVFKGRSRARCVQAKRGRRVDRVVERRKARGERHSAAAIAARSSSASVRSSTGSAMRRS